jgi:hypothetical protein
MASRLTASLREAPATVPALVALALFVVWATDQAGYPLTHWAPGGLIVLGLLAIAVGLIGVRSAQTPRAVQVSLVALAAYTALSFLSILWANVPGDAWEGANRTLLYLLVFALFAVWRAHGSSTLLLVGSWTVAMIVLALVELLRLDAASAAHLQSLVPGGRLAFPSGYANANAAQWLMAFWPALLLARGPRPHFALRGLLAGGAVLLAGSALLSQSRGSLYATPAMLVLVFALIPGRVRTFALLVPVGAAVAATARRVLDVGDDLHAGLVSTATMHRAVESILIASLAVAALVALAAAAESRASISPQAAARVRMGVAAVALATLAAVILAGLIAAGNPVHRLESAWHSFKGGYSATSTGSRLTSGLGSNRYDFYRVALDEFTAHPLLGIGVDNFEQPYLAHGRSAETPHYPHSVELRTLSQTGLLGALFALVGLAAALLAVWRALRGPDPLARSVAAAAAAGFGYWLVHGSIDWFWEFAGLGAPAFALLGIACSLAPAGIPRARAPEPDRGRARPRVLAWALAVVVGVAVAASFAAPWLSELQVQSAVRVWARQPAAAYERLREARDLNPLGDQPDLLAGSIALRHHELLRADRYFSAALQRTPGDAYATLERGAIASNRGERATALRLLERAARLNPRDQLTREALGVASAGRRIDIDALNRLILAKGEELA